MQNLKQPKNVNSMNVEKMKVTKTNNLIISNFKLNKNKSQYVKNQ